MSKETMTPDRLSEIVTRIFMLDNEKKILSEDISELKKEVFEGGIDKKGLNEAIRLAKIPKDERDVIMTIANKILRDTGRGELDLGSFV